MLGVGLAVNQVNLRGRAYTPPESADHLWLFNEGSGDVVADLIGAADIDLTIAENAAWNATGIRTTDGRIETPSLTGVRTVAVAYRVDYNSAYSGAGYLIGADAGNVGITQYSGGSFANVYQTQGESYHQVMRRVPPENGTQAYSLGSGGWLIVWLDYGTSKNTPLWIGGRGGADITTNRVPVMDIGAVMVLGDSIPDLIASGEMQQAEDYLCAMLKGRGIYVRNRDCPVQAVGALVIGESDMSGRGVLTDLSEGDRTQVFTRTSIMSSTGAAASATTPGDLVIGTNQMAADGAYNAAANFGIELGIAAGYEAGPNSGKRLVISKTAKGSTYNAVLNANGANDPGASFTWDTSTTPFTVVLAGLAVREWFRINAAMRLQGIGAPLLVVFNSLTKNDGKNTVYTGEASDYLALRQRLKSFILSWTNTPAANIDWIELGCPSTFEGSDATAVAAIQTALADFAAADDTVQIVSTEDWPFLADGIHWTSQTIYDAGKAMAALADKLAA